jgi:hypothetical protein
MKMSKNLPQATMRSTGHAYPFAVIAPNMGLIGGLPECRPLISRRRAGGFIFE